MPKRTKQAQISKETKDRICKEAIRLFREQGYQDTTIAEICEAAGISSGAIYYHFGSKRDLLLYIEKELWQTSMDIENIDELLENVRGSFKKYVDDYTCKWAEEIGPDLTKEIFSAFEPYDYTEDYKNAHGNLRSLATFIAAAQEKGKFITTISPAKAAFLFSTLCKGVVYDWCTRKGSFDLRHQIQAVLDWILPSFLIEETE